MSFHFSAWNRKFTCWMLQKVLRRGRLLLRIARNSQEIYLLPSCGFMATQERRNNWQEMKAKKSPCCCCFCCDTIILQYSKDLKFSKHGYASNSAIMSPPKWRSLHLYQDLLYCGFPREKVWLADSICGHRLCNWNDIWMWVKGITGTCWQLPSARGQGLKSWDSVWPGLGWVATPSWGSSWRTSWSLCLGYPCSGS